MEEEKDQFGDAVFYTVGTVLIACLYVCFSVLSYSFFFSEDPLKNFMSFIFGLGFLGNILVLSSLSGLVFLGEYIRANYLLNAIYLTVLASPWIFMVLFSRN